MADPDPATLGEHYSEMSDGELMSLADEKELLETAARRLLDSELQRRGLAESDVVAFRAEVERESHKAERTRRKRLYRILVGAGGPWERAYSYWNWATLGAFGTGYILHVFGCRNPLLIVGGAVAGFLTILPVTIYAARRLAPRQKGDRTPERNHPSH